MGGSGILRLYLLDDRTVDIDRVTLIVDRLGTRREVRGACPEWLVRSDTTDITEAMRACGAELTELDPRWFEILDLKALERGVPRPGRGGP